MRTGSFWSRHTHAALVLAAGGGVTLHYALGDRLAHMTRAAENRARRGTVVQGSGP